MLDIKFNRKREKVAAAAATYLYLSTRIVLYRTLTRSHIDRLLRLAAASVTYIPKQRRVKHHKSLTLALTRHHAPLSLRCQLLIVSSSATNAGRTFSLPFVLLTSVVSFRSDRGVSVATILSSPFQSSLSPAVTSFVDSCTVVLTSVSFLSLSFLAALLSPVLPAPNAAMSASHSTAPNPALFTTKRGQLRETLAGTVSSPWMLYALLFSPLGLFGAHHAWLGHWKRFLAYAITFGLWGGGWLYDLLHVAELAKEQHEQQQRAATHSSGTTALSPCTMCAAWALHVEGKTGTFKDKHDSSPVLPRLHSTAPSTATTSATWSTPVPLPAAAHPMHHTALADAFPLPPPPAPSHSHVKRKSDADEIDRPTSVRVRSAEVQDHAERTRLDDRTELHSDIRPRKEDAEKGGRERQAMQREEETKRGGHNREEARGDQHERAATQQHDEQGNRHQQLKHAMLEQQYTSEVGSGGAPALKPAEGVVYLQTITPSKGNTTAPNVQRITYDPPAGAVPQRPVEPVTVIRPTLDGSGGDTDAATTHKPSTAPVIHPFTRVAAPSPPAASEAEDGTSGDGGVADVVDEQQGDGSSNHGNVSNGGRDAHAGNGGGRNRRARGRRG